MEKLELVQKVNGSEYMVFEFFTENLFVLEALNDKIKKHKGMIQKFDVKKTMFDTFKSCDCRVLIPVENAFDFAK